MIYYFIYETTCLINHKKYRGIHKTENINDGYLGSGKSLLLAVDKYGKDNFTKEILEFCNSYDDLIELEKVYVDEEWVKDISNYNLKTGGQSAGILSDESKKKISNTLKEGYRSGRIKVVISPYIPTDEQKENMSKILKDKYQNEEHNRKGCEPWNKGKTGQESWNKGLKTGPQSEESKAKKSKTLKERYKHQDHPTKGMDPWNKGKKGVQEAWNKGKEMEKVECPHCGKKCDKLNAKKWHFDKCKCKLKNV